MASSGLSRARAAALRPIARSKLAMPSDQVEPPLPVVLDRVETLLEKGDDRVAAFPARRIVGVDLGQVHPRVDALADPCRSRRAATPRPRRGGRGARARSRSRSRSRRSRDRAATAAANSAAACSTRPGPAAAPSPGRAPRARRRVPPASRPRRRRGPLRRRRSWSRRRPADPHRAAATSSSRQRRRRVSPPRRHQAVFRMSRSRRPELVEAQVNLARGAARPQQLVRHPREIAAAGLEQRAQVLALDVGRHAREARLGLHLDLDAARARVAPCGAPGFGARLARRRRPAGASTSGSGTSRTAGARASRSAARARDVQVPGQAEHQRVGGQQLELAVVARPVVLGRAAPALPG